MIANVVAKLVGSRELLLTGRQIAIHDDIFRLVALIQKTSVAVRQVITKFDSKAKIFDQIINRAYGSLVHFASG